MQIFATDIVRRAALRLHRLWSHASTLEVPLLEPDTAGAAPVQALGAYRELRRIGSNLELDWLWLAAQLPDPADRCYCLERALAINPHSEEARRELVTLARAVAAESGGATPTVPCS